MGLTGATFTRKTLAARLPAGIGIGIQLLLLGLTIGYGHINGTVEAGLDTNQGLADEVQPYRAGVVIHMLDVVGASEEGVMLWG